MKILKKYKQGNQQVTEYTKDGKNVSHIVKSTITTDVSVINKEQSSTEEKILAETQYQTMILELNMFGGI